MKLVPDKAETYPTRRGSGGVSLLLVAYHFAVHFRLLLKALFPTGKNQNVRPCSPMLHEQSWS